MATTVHRVHLPHAHKVYQGSGESVDKAIINAHGKIPRHRQGPGLNKQTMELLPAKEGPADVAIRCKVLDLHYEAGGIGGRKLFHARVVED